MMENKIEVKDVITKDDLGGVIDVFKLVSVLLKKSKAKDVLEAIEKKSQSARKIKNFIDLQSNKDSRTFNMKKSKVYSNKHKISPEEFDAMSEEEQKETIERMDNITVEKLIEHCDFQIKLDNSVKFLISLCNAAEADDGSLQIENNPFLNKLLSVKDYLDSQSEEDTK